MRREFIILLLGIISISSFSSILQNYSQVDTTKLLLDTVTGNVGWGNFSYWKLSHEGPIIIELTSVSGDADLYVSETERPSFEPDRNNFSSATCGLDVIRVPTEFPRPIGIGVYGHWYFEVSEYVIEVYLDTAALEEDFGQLMSRLPVYPETEPELEPKTKSDRIGHRKTEEEDNKRKSHVYRVLSMINMVLDLFIL